MRVGKKSLHSPHPSTALNTIAVYPIAPVSDAVYPVQAQAFVDYVLCPAGQAVLAEFGFIPNTAP